MPGIGRSTVAIIGAQNATPWGTGMLVGPRHVLTCAHVIGDVLGNRDAIAKIDTPPRDNTIRIRFTVAERPTIIAATVIRWSRYFERIELATNETAERYPIRDLALLELDADPPEHARPVRFWHPADPGRCDRLLKDRDMVAAGYPFIGEDAFHSLEFAYDALTDGEEMLFRQTRSDFDDKDLSGLSGAGLVVREYGLVIGMVMEVGTQRNLVVVKPARQLEQFWPELRLVIHGCELEKWHKVPDQLLPEIDRSDHCRQVYEAAVTCRDAGPGVMLAGVLGHNENRIIEWIDHLVARVVQPKLRIRLGDWVALPQPISVARPGRRLNPDDVVWQALDDLAKRLGIRHTSLEDDAFIDLVRGVLNEEDVGAANRVDPPPYIVFQFSARRFGPADAQVMERLIRFWDNVAAGRLDRVHLVFFTLVAGTADETDPDLDLSAICTSIRESFTPYKDVTIIDPVPGVRMADIIMWIRDYEDEVDDLWRINSTTAHRYRQVVRDIFRHEAGSEELSLELFKKQLDSLELCRKYQEM
ncbi:hypothetical protein DSCO28_62470 [Desulfosarcina ovata subsp. sediminis]|uniref:Serine protease n=1 Tax=Desulfosarcina ovata subsp. sediminis TaxID=885957 RepID=A0A5K7ZZW0_9BACT|nr:serine protease [Desulfosarcina ovata]BBO85681.1 hypothetical protein DSCO28_62470 [Desulfosarcina ovata subsp. sediminis]